MGTVYVYARVALTLVRWRKWRSLLLLARMARAGYPA